MYSGDELKRLAVVISGSFRGEMTDSTGKVLKIEDLKEGSIIASAFLVNKKNKIPVDVVANNDVELLIIEKADFIELMNKNAIINNNFIEIISSMAIVLAEKLRFITLKPLKSKVCDYVIKQMKGEKKEYVTLPHSHQSLADLFGVSRPSLGRIFKDLDDLGIIKVDKREVTICDFQKLKKCADNF
ncbi:MAG: Crp/Fnr family transcriptional regulator [Candidatus Delongbacteria bacterium]|nr:Crp/Fnr family transcriptional regulator [Candidatus Delongbacteria bacterium]MBN2835050.1 Crp/Fnr family transcriptional regulator [Candidatus Delongbacteria bacterium]